MVAYPSEAIKNALQSLLDRSDVSSVPDPRRSPREAMAASVLGYTYFPFVVFQDRGTGKFVQFTGDRGRLMIDLPIQSLTSDEHERAADLFSMLGASNPSVSQMYEYPSGEPGDINASYQAPFGANVDSATSAALDVFSIVFHIPETSLDLEVLEE